jgi:hypothetical protein
MKRHVQAQVIEAFVPMGPSTGSGRTGGGVASIPSGFSSSATPFSVRAEPVEASIHTSLRAELVEASVPTGPSTGSGRTGGGVASIPSGFSESATPFSVRAELVEASIHTSVRAELVEASVPMDPSTGSGRTGGGVPSIPSGVPESATRFSVRAELVEASIHPTVRAELVEASVPTGPSTGSGRTEGSVVPITPGVAETTTPTPVRAEPVEASIHPTVRAELVEASVPMGPSTGSGRTGEGVRAELVEASIHPPVQAEPVEALFHPCAGAFLQVQGERPGTSP